uniref:GAG-pre-integrase domain-containing protein n=1 Tax=Davidia involucrata TaxID=16924 RepID=A0A5B7BWS7_DAVIN
MVKDICTWRILYQGPSINGLYPIQATSQSPKHYSAPKPSTATSTPSTTAASTAIASSSTANLGQKVSQQLWHDRLGHPSNQILHKDLSQATGLSPLNNLHDASVCEPCILAKMSKLPFPLSTTVTAIAVS